VVVGKPDTGKLAGMLTTDQAAEMLDVSERTVRRWCEEGRLKATRIDPESGGSPWRIPQEAVDRFLEARKRQLDGDPDSP
jgi:excisionase family DNA binding protein